MIYEAIRKKKKKIHNQMYEYISQQLGSDCGISAAQHHNY